MTDPLDITNLPYRRNPARVTSRFNFQSCLVSATPNGGWALTVEIKGVPAEVDGATPLAVFHNLEERLHANGAKDFSPVDVWCNLNMVWMANLHERHHKVNLPTFLTFLNTVEVKTFENSNQIKHPLSEWLHLNWGAMEIYLCGENYNWADFQILASSTLRVLDPIHFPSIGNQAVHDQMRIRVHLLQSDPAYTREAARAWLVLARQDVSDPDYKGSPLWVR